MARVTYFLSGAKIDGPLKRMYVPGHIYYFETNNLKQLLQNAGFEVKLIEQSDTPARALFDNKLLAMCFKLISVLRNMFDRCYESNVVCLRNKESLL